MTVLQQDILAVLLPGFTHHVNIGQEADATISYGATGLARMVLPGKPPMSGEWHPLADGYHIAWHGGPTGDWKIAHSIGQLTYIDPTGREAGTITRIEPISEWPAD